MTRSILITGGQGFVGRAWVERFNALGFRTICADLNDKPLGGAAFEGVAFIKLDVRDKAAVIAACQGVDSIIHNASLWLDDGLDNLATMFKLHVEAPYHLNLALGEAAALLDGGLDPLCPGVEALGPAEVQHLGLAA